MIDKVLCLIFNKYSHNIYLSLITIYSSFFNRLKMFLKGIDYGDNVSFIGDTKFYRTYDSKVRIGSDCNFRSKDTSNFIGINRPCMISTLLPSAKISIGKNCGFSGTVIGAFCNISLGENVRCGANTLITDSDWHLDDPRSGKPNPIVIGNNVWLGEGVKVLKGVSIGDNTVIGAGSIVTKNIPANVIAAGNPARILKEL